MEDLKLGKYKHFKGELVEVLYVAHHSETLEEFVVYKTLYDNRTFGKGSIWIRPKKMFLENIQRDGKIMKRFEFVND
ncbi:DUF1653 domain-containing protein [Candidatus Woesearchaeota archaeon]|nr:DUF1653 domain-containing protein [Candidatus Woesearchaeota archaeon]MCF7901447.1 DUF1653 domain-containing protein [Candidatus Woesearchaeota archaeon]MCF8013532.1 DUF1653 domain-containing protein [Candidatus Woesearchaeota archaeon]